MWIDRDIGMIDYFAGAQVVPESDWFDLRGMSVIYAIRHVESGKFYVGSAVDLYRRWKQHRHSLNAGTHRNRKLQNAWNKYGKSAFEFLVVEACDREHAVLLEQVWLDWTQAVKLGYNLTPTAGSLLGLRHTGESKAKISAAKTGWKMSDDAKAKISAANTGLKRSDEHREAISSAHKGKKHTPEQAAKAAAARTDAGRAHTEDTKAKLSEKAKGRKRSPESIAKGAATATGKKRSPEAIAKTAAANTGKKRSDEFRQKMSEMRTGKPLSEDHKKVLVDKLYERSPVNEEIFKSIQSRYVRHDKANSARALAKEFGLSYSTVMKIVNGKYRRFS